MKKETIEKDFLNLYSLYPSLYKNLQEKRAASATPFKELSFWVSVSDEFVPPFRESSCTEVSVTHCIVSK